jgi:hypothetical protein
MEQVLVCEVGDGNDLDPGVYGHLYGVGPDVPGSSDDHYGLTPSRLSTLEEHLPGGHGDDGGRGCFDVIQRPRFASDHPGHGYSELGLGATELWVGDA